jgi:hypothetical protein
MPGVDWMTSVDISSPFLVFKAGAQPSALSVSGVLEVGTVDKAKLAFWAAENNPKSDGRPEMSQNGRGYSAAGGTPRRDFTD